MWVTAAIAGGAIIGGVTSTIASNNASDSADKALNAQKDASNSQLQLEKDQFEYGKKLNEPFYNMGLPAAATYAATINGKPQEYTDLAGNKQIAQAMNPTDNPAYKWQQQQMEKNTGRSLRAMGRYNSTYGMDAITKGNSGLAASEYDKQLGRLADLTNVARGGASSLAGLSSQYATNAGNNIVNSGNNQANASLAGGLMQNNALQNGTQNMFSLANLGIKAYGNNSPSYDYNTAMPDSIKNPTLKF